MEQDIKKAIEIMRAGGIILYPTDTVWGLGCDATNPTAIKRIYAIKQREESKSLILLVDSMTKVQSYVEEVPDIAWDINELSEKPTTIIYDKARSLPKNIISKDGSIAIRVTNEQFSKKLCERMKIPIVSTSANISGDPTPQTFHEITPEIINSVDYIVNYRRKETTNPSPSSIIKMSVGGKIKIIRE